MNISVAFIRRPVMTTVLSFALVACGTVAYLRLPVSELPNVDFPTISVSASLPGANPKEMAATVATPLERRLGGIAGLIAMSSASTTGKTTIALQFALSRNIDAAAEDVQIAISQSSRQLPPNMPTPPTLSKVNPADNAIVYLALTGDRLPLTDLDEYAETQIAEQIAEVPGVAQVQVFGSYQYATRIYLNPYALSARHLTLDMVSDAIRNSNTSLPSGTLYGGTRTYTVESNGQLANAQAYNHIVIAERDGAPVHLNDVGKAVDGIQQDRQLTTFSDATTGGELHPAVMLAIRRQPGANTVAVARGIQELLPRLTRQAPGDATLRLLYTRADFVRDSVREVRNALLAAMGLVIAVVFLFLRRAGTTLISALSLPVSLLGTFVAMRLLGFNLDHLSLMGLTLATGFIIDDAIVVLENIVRLRERGVPQLLAAESGTAEISSTVVSMTLSLVAVFIPILLMGGMLGRLFREFAVTVSAAILLSGLVSLTLTPMLCAVFGAAGAERLRTPPGMSRAQAWYRRSLVRSLAHWPSLLGAAAFMLVLAIGLFAWIPKGLMPSEDTGQIIGTTLAPDGTTFEQLNDVQQNVARIVQRNPAVATVMSNAGQGWGSTGGNNLGLLYMGLKPVADRSSGAEVRAQLRQALAHVQGLDVFIENPSTLNLNSINSNAEFQYVLQSPGIDALYREAPRFEQLLRQVRGLRDVSSDLSLNNPQLKVDLRREAASALGVTAEQVQSTLAEAYGGQQVSTIYGPANEYWVMMQLAPQYQTNPRALDALYVTGAGQNLVPLSAVAGISAGAGPVSVSHYGQLPAVTLSFNLDPGTSLGVATERIETLARKSLSAQVTADFAGAAKSFTESSRELLLLLGLSVLVIYVVLAVLYEHFIHPITILTALPLAMVGGLLALLACGQELNVFSFVGLVLLIGLVKKNGIIMVDFALQMRREQGLSASEAIVEACTVRFRPIMMTTLAAILGTLPLALGSGAGIETRRPLGIAAAGGLLVSQFLTLYITPAFYLAMENLGDWYRRNCRGDRADPGGRHAL
ncbi:MAG TPA: efflux RND transporter permease subunit [Steroidobacteraceae bacterium]|nr:efflux RND transporter permease subunit [Steroidobacteraceae bacterium]